MGRNGGGSRRGCGFCLRQRRSCLCPGMAGKMPGGLLLRLLLTAALCPGILGTGTAPLPLLPEAGAGTARPTPLGWDHVPWAAPHHPQLEAVRSGRGGGGPCWGWEPGVVVPELVPLWGSCGARGTAPVGQGEPGRPALGCRAGLCPPLLLVPFPGSVPVPQPRAHHSCRSLGAEPAPLRGLRRPRRPLPPRLLLPAPHRPGHAPVLLPARPPRPQVLLLTGGRGGPHRGEPLQPPRAWPPPVSGAGRGGGGLRGWQHGPGGGLALGGAWC